MEKEITYICECGEDKRIKPRYHNGNYEGHYCLKCWNIIKKDIDKTFICSECGSKKASKRYISTGVGKNEYLHDILCDSCFIDMLYECRN